VIVMSHLGRPREGVPVADQPEVSLAPVARHLAGLTGYRVQLIDNYVDGFELPEADIDGGELPEYEVDTMDVDVDTETKEVEVPVVDVEMPEEDDDDSGN